MKKLIKNIGLTLSGITLVWSSSVLLSGLASVNWDINELLRQYLMASGLIQENYTLVDFYTHIKGVEYLVSVAFLCAFPLMFKYLDKNTIIETTK